MTYTPPLKESDAMPKGGANNTFGAIISLKKAQDDWLTVALGKVVDFLDSKRRPIKAADRARMRGIFPYYGASGVVDYVNNYLFDEPLILLGEDGENILSRALPLAFMVQGKIWVNNHAHVLRPKDGINHAYLCSYLESIDYDQYNSGTAQPKLNKKTCEAIPIRLPRDEKQQKAIAEALSDADALIEGLERLIAKNRLIKEGAMQELLSGARRLPGFSGEWQRRPIGQFLTVMHGKSQRGVEDVAGPYPILATGGKIGWARSFLCDKPAVLIGRKGTIDKPQYMDMPFWTIDTLFYSNVSEPNSAKFLYYKFCLIDWRQYNEASGVPSLNGRTIESIEIDAPEPDEQRAIAAVISDLESEIDTLEAKLAKARQIKQGMMQELLTGRIRLV